MVGRTICGREGEVMPRASQLGESTATRRYAANSESAESEADRRVRLLSKVTATRRKLDQCDVDLSSLGRALEKLQAEVDRREQVRDHAMDRHLEADREYRADVDADKRDKALEQAILDAARPRIGLGDILS